MQVADVFQEAHGRAPEGIWRAPGRVNLIGEHTDYNDGFVLPFALPWGVSVAAARRADRTVTIRSLQAPGEAHVLDDLDRAEGWVRYAAGAVWALRDAGYEVGGADLVLDGDVPRGAGLSSSAALEVAVVVALDDLYGLGLDRMELARLARRAENEFVGMPCGIMDQAASALCTEGHALFLDCRSLGHRNVPLDVAKAGMRFLIIDTGVHHELADGRYAQRRRECENAAKRLGVAALRDVTDLNDALARLDGAERRRTQHVVTENHRVEALVGLLRAGAVTEIGALLNASHLSLRYQFEVSCPELDVAVEAAVRGGARGARMTGGGFGGSAIALVPADRVASVQESVNRAYRERGFAAPRFLEAVPSAGARRLA